MSQACAVAVAWETWVDYFAGELAEADETALEEHLLGCGACAALAAGVAQVTESLRAMIAPVISPQRLDALRRRGTRVRDNPMRPGEVKSVAFPRGIDLLVQRLSGLDLSHVTRVSLCLRDERAGGLMLEVEDAPFDRARGEVLVACQQHFASFPHDVVFELTAWQNDGTQIAARYTVRHQFEAMSGA